FDVIGGALERRWASLADAPEIVWRRATPPNVVEIVTARDEAGEARAVAARVAAAIARGAPPERVAIVAPPRARAVLEPLRAALEEAGVPHSEPRGRAAAETPEGRVTLALLSLAEGPVSREDVLELLRAPGLRLPGPLASPRRAAALAHRLREVPV